MTIRNTPGSLSAFNTPVSQLIRMAYQMQDFQIIGAPDWANTDRFDVDGRFDPAAAPPGPPPQVPQMSRVAFDRSRRPFPGYRAAGTTRAEAGH
jgi:uncharacterized protein (TIGR03435 family)